MWRIVTGRVVYDYGAQPRGKIIEGWAANEMSLHDESSEQLDSKIFHHRFVYYLFGPCVNADNQWPWLELPSSST